jgi:hypothetical protein
MNSAVAKNMPDVIEEMIVDAKRRLEAEDFDITSSGGPEDVARTAKFMDRLDQDFLKTMEWWIDKEEREGNPKKGKKP